MKSKDTVNATTKKWKIVLQILGIGKKAPKTKVGKAFRWGERFVIAVCVIYSLLVAFPQPLFAYSVERSGVTIYSRSPLPNTTNEVIDRVMSNVGKCDLYNAKASFRVFVCNNSVLYRFFSPLHPGSFGISSPVTGNVFIAQADIARNRAYRFGTSFNERSLHSTIAHEITHELIRRKVGIIHAFLIPRWVEDGYCDYVSEDSTLPEDEGTRMLICGQQTNSMAFQYFVWRKMVEYSIKVQKRSFEDLSRSPGDPSAVRKEMTQWLIYRNKSEHSVAD